jgi:hypothetical protein
VTDRDRIIIMLLTDLPDGVLDKVLRACDADADAANLSSSCASIRRVAGPDLVRRVLRRAKARGARYAEMLRLSAEYEAIPEIARREDARSRRSWWWWRIDWAPNPPIEHIEAWTKARQIAHKWFELLDVGDVLTPGVVVKEKNTQGVTQCLIEGDHYYHYLYPTSRVLVPPRSDAVLF